MLELVEYKVVHDTPDWLLFIPGLGCNPSDYASIVPSLPFSSFSLNLYNFPLSVSSFSQLAILISDQVEILCSKHPHLAAKPIIVGHSMGGAIALECSHFSKAIISLEGNLSDECCGILSSKISAYTRRDFVNSFQSFLDTFRSSHVMKKWVECAIKWDPESLHNASCVLVEWSRNRHQSPCKLVNKESFYYIYGQRSLPEHCLELLKDCDVNVDHVFEIPNAGHFIAWDNSWELQKTLLLILEKVVS
ncbi:hypothetical protein RCL1_006225 [Eukaryota sp. TZLM3-RCL]